MGRYNLIEKIIIIMFNIFSFLTFCFFANLLKGLLVGIVLFVVFVLINNMIPENKRIHADSLLHCFVLSIFFLLSCVLVYKFSLNYMTNFESIALSISLVILASFITTNSLWWKRNELNARVYEWVKFNINNEELMKYREQLQQNDKKKYYIYVYYYEEQKSISQISKIMDIDIQRIGEEIAIMPHHIEYGIRLK